MSVEKNTDNAVDAEVNGTTEAEEKTVRQTKIGNKLSEMKERVSEKTAPIKAKLKPHYDNAAKISLEEWTLLKSSAAQAWKTHASPAIKDNYHRLGKPVVNASLDLTFAIAKIPATIISDTWAYGKHGYQNGVKPNLKYAYQDIKPAVDFVAKPVERLFPETTAKVKSKLENGVTDPANTLKAAAAYTGAAAVLSYKSVIWTAEALFAVLKAPYTGYRKYRDWEPQNPTANKVKDVADLPFDVLDAVVSPVAKGIKNGYDKYNYAFKSVPFPFSVGVFAVGGAVITYTTLHATKYLLDAGAGQISDSAPKKDIMTLEGAYQFAAPKLSKVALYKPMIITFKTSRDGFFESDLYNNNLKPAYLELIDPIVKEAKEILSDVDHRVDEIAPIWQQATNTVRSIAAPTEEQKLENKKARARAIENIKWSATNVVAPAAIVAGPALAYIDRTISIPFAVAVTTGLSVVQSRRWHKNNVQDKINDKIDDKFDAAVNDNPETSNDNNVENKADKKPDDKAANQPAVNLPEVG